MPPDPSRLATGGKGMAHTFKLITADGEDLGTVQLARPDWPVGSVIHQGGDRPNCESCGASWRARTANRCLPSNARRSDSGPWPPPVRADGGLRRHPRSIHADLTRLSVFVKFENDVGVAPVIGFRYVCVGDYYVPDHSDLVGRRPA